jgi:hypothetical protein
VVACAPASATSFSLASVLSADVSIASVVAGAEIVLVVGHAAYADKLLTFSALSCSLRGLSWGFGHCDL